jgi:glucose-6-phosphate isomerase
VGESLQTEISVSRLDSALATALATPAGSVTVERRLSDLRGCFADIAAYAGALAESDPVIYSIATVDTGDGAGDLHYGVGTILPGRVGDEYHLTRGHVHAWRSAAEVYVGVAGSGALLLEDVRNGSTSLIDLGPGTIAYVPACAAHRTINVGDEPFIYLGVYPARAGHDYAAIAERNFARVVVAVDGHATLSDRAAHLATLS